MDRVSELRQTIDCINLEILKLLSKRAEIVVQIGQQHTSQGLPHYDPVREKDMLDLLEQHNPGPFPTATIRSLFKEIFKASLSLEETQDKRGFLVSRNRKSGDTVVSIGDISLGGTFPPVLIAGPCALESQEQADSVARYLKDFGVRIYRGGAYKPRTSPYGFQGLGVAGLRLGSRAAHAHGMCFVTEVMDTRDVEKVVQYADILQVGSRNMHNFSLLREVGKQRKPVLLKRGFSATIEEWFYAAEYILSEGNPNVILCERGIRTFEKKTRNTLDLSAVALAKLETHLPVVVDVTHAAGRRDILPALAKAALAAGADGIHVEVHPNPATARSDNEQQLDFEQFEQFYRAIAPGLKSRNHDGPLHMDPGQP
ncbi:MAG: bifunctional 3-deoxy-7-phosphoheptulonate synthase/chorismate mutase [Deinococcaceae bacterium]